MRLWSIHPKYLDSKGLVALWREGLLAKHVLEGKTKGYTKHPQLIRFRSASNPAAAINQYLAEVWKEAVGRNYSFDKGKLSIPAKMQKLKVTSGQIEYEKEHLLRKLGIRDKEKLNELLKAEKIESHPIFSVFEGGVEEWEKLR